MKATSRIHRLFLCFFVIGMIWHAPKARARSLSVTVGETTTVTFAELGYQDLQLTGMYGSASIWVPFESDWDFEDAIEVNVRYVASPLLFVERSTLTVLANGFEVTSLRPEPSGQEEQFSFTIPVNLLHGAGVSLRFQGYLRLTDVVCEETNNPGQWLRILESSTITMKPVADAAPPDLADLPGSVLVKAVDYAASPPPTVFVLPDEPTAQEMSLAGQIAARFGAELGSGMSPFQVEFPSSLSESVIRDANLVVIGTPSRQPLIDSLAQALPAPLVDGGYVTEDNRIAPGDDGVLQIFPSPWNPDRRVLLVSAASEAGLERVALAFTDRDTFHVLSGPYMFIRDRLPAVEPIPGPPWLTERTTFAQLGEGDRLVRGTGVYQEVYYFHRPAGWIFDNGAQLVLRFASSTALSSRESYIAVYVNDIPVGATRIGPDIPEREAVFDLPITRLNQAPDGSRPQALTLRLEVANYLQEAQCEQIHPDAAWTRIQADSYFVTPHVYLALPDLQAFPYPFVSDQPTAETVIAVPPQPRRREMALALDLAAYLGRYQVAEAPLHILSADQINEETHRDAHLIVLGQRSRQPLVDAFLDVMGAIPGYRGEAGLYRALSTPYQGLIREGPSPWNPDRVALLVFGESEAGFENAMYGLLSGAPPVGQPGSVALVDDNRNVRVIYRSIDAPPGPEPGQVNREPLIPKPQSWLVITLVLVLTTAAVWLIIWLARRRALKS